MDFQRILKPWRFESQEGDTSWIDRICYYSKLVVSSAGYWRYKKAELYSWIQHHVDAGHGPPTFSWLFLRWIQMARHQKTLTDRFQCANLSVPDIEKTSFVRFINDYTIIIQEYFQERLQLWLNTVGRNVSYQILLLIWIRSFKRTHAHMLEFMKILMFYKNIIDCVWKQNFTSFIFTRMGRTNISNDSIFAQKCSIGKDSGPHPNSILYDLTDLTRDKAACLVCLQNHDCNGYCMQKTTL
jgi:hypothetical protein